MTLRTADEYQRLANRRLPPFIAEYVNGGSYTEHTLRRNVEDLRTIELRQLFARPTWRGYRTPDASLYLCSASTPPGGGVHGMCGYHAAQAALRHARLP